MSGTRRLASRSEAAGLQTSATLTLIDLADEIAPLLRGVHMAQNVIQRPPVQAGAIICKHTSRVRIAHYASATLVAT
jgi:hypothetical protein